MSTVYRLILALVVTSFLAVGCTATTSPTPIPPTHTPLPIKDTPVPPIVTALSANPAPVPAANAIAFFAFDPSGEKSEIKVIQTNGRIGPSIPNTSGAATAAWSPDGKRIAFIVHHGDRDWAMDIVDADGQNLQHLTQGNLDYNPSWSPDGTQIAFSRNGNLWVMRISNDHQPVTSDLRQLTTDPKELVWGIAWSPDGTQIAFDSQMGNPKGTASYQDPTTTEIYLINADGSNLRKLTDNQTIDAGPGWSPDGKQIVFFSNRDGDPNYTMKKAFAAKSDGAFQIYTMTVDGQNVQRLTNTTANDMQPTWSLDGKQIAFSSNRDGNYEIYVMNAEGSNPTRLTETHTQDYQPAWLPAISPQLIVTPTTVPESSRVIREKSYDKKQNDLGEDFLIANDGGFYIVGTTNLDFSGSGALSDIYLIRTDENGEVLWDKTYGGDKSEEGLSISRTNDGNLLIAGTTQSSGADAYLIQIDLEGNEIWSKTFGTPLDESASVRELADGSFMLWGNSVDPNDFVADPGAAGYGGYSGRSNIYLTKVDAAGNQLWSQTIGGKNNLLASGGVESSDGGFVVLASLLRFPDPGDDIYLIKLDKDGNKIWDHTWEDGTMGAYDLIHTTDDNYLIAGSYIPMDGTAQAKADFLFIKVDQQGDEIWISTFGDPEMVDYPQVAAETADGGYIALGEWVKDWSGSYPASISIAKIDASGQPVWQEVIKTASQHSILRAILQHPDGSSLIVGSKMMRGKFDIFLMKVDIGASSSAYLGQTSPGLTPQVFAPGIVSIPSAMDFAGTFSPDGTEFYFTRRVDNGENVIFEAHLVNGAWTDPAPASFASGFVAFEPHVTADNQTIYFGWAHSQLSAEKSSLEDGGIWATDRTASGWSDPRYVGAGMFVSSDQGGQIYVTTFSASGGPNLSKVMLTDRRFTTFENIGSGVHPAIAPDGSYLVYDDGNGNLRVRFLLEDGTWGIAKDLTKQGIPASAAIASISPDGNYLFYVDKGDLYWVSTELIKNLKDK